MSYRKVILATNEIYHIYNRGVEKRPIFLRHSDYSRLLELIRYYRFKNCPFKYSHLKKISCKERESVIKKLEADSNKLVEIFTFCFMPNHFHFLIKQLTENGITKFMSKIQNGFSHYFNKRHDRVGHLFQGNFGSTRIQNNEQLLQVNRYIHLNPVTSFLVKIENLNKYKYSSFLEYINENKGFCNIEEVLSFFKGIDDYKKFVYNQAEYEKNLENINHLIIDDDKS